MGTYKGKYVGYKNMMGLRGCVLKEVRIDNIIIWCDINHFRKVYLTNRRTRDTIFWNKVKISTTRSNRLGAWSSSPPWIWSQRSTALNSSSWGEMMSSLTILPPYRPEILSRKDSKIYPSIEKNCAMPKGDIRHSMKRRVKLKAMSSRDRSSANT